MAASRIPPSEGISVIDPDSETVINRVDLGRLGSGSLQSLAFGPSGARLYVSRLPPGGPPELVILEAGAWLIADTIVLQNILTLGQIAVTADGRYLYATVLLSFPGPFGFAAFELPSGSPVFIEPLPSVVNTMGTAMAIAPDGTGAWYSDFRRNLVVAISLDRGPDTSGPPVFTRVVTLPFTSDLKTETGFEGPIGVRVMPALYGLPDVAGVLNAANFLEGPIAPESWVSIFGENLADELIVTSSIPLPTSLGGTRVTVTDAPGTERSARIQFVSPEQLNFLMPPDTAPGSATVTVTNASGQTSSLVVQVGSVGPGIFSANGSGMGPAAATFQIVEADGSRSEGLTFDPAAPSGTRTNVPIDLGPPGRQIYLSFFGTGFRFQSSRRFK